MNDLIVVSGLPRSGTSMAMQMLVAAGLEPITDGHRRADASNERGYFEDQRVQRLAKDATWLLHETGECIKIVVPLVDHVPDRRFRVVMMVRDLDRVLASQSSMLERTGRQHRPAAALRPAFERMLNQSRRILAERRVPVLELDYDQVIESPREQAERLAAWLDRENRSEAMRQVVDTSLRRS